MGPEESPRSPVFVLGGAAGVLLVLFFAASIIIRDNDTADLAEGSDAAIALDRVDTESITPAIGSMTTIARHGDNVLIVDGIATEGDLDPWAEGAEPLTRVWVVDAKNPDRAQPYDLPSVGPRLYPQLTWWDGQWALLGLRCPEPWDPADVKAQYEAQGEAHEPEECGSEVSDAFLFDPSTASVRGLATGLAARTFWRGVNGERAILADDNGRVDFPAPYEDLWMLSLDGTRMDIADIPGRGYQLLPVGDEFVALQVDSRGDYRGELHDVAEFWQLHRLRFGEQAGGTTGTGWVSEEMPLTGIEHRTNDGGSAGNDFILTEGRVGRASVNDPRPPETPLVLLVADSTGNVYWEQVGVDGIPNPPDRVDLIDGQIIWSTESGAWRWDDGQWLAAPGVGDIYVEDFTRLMYFEQTERFGAVSLTIQ